MPPTLTKIQIPEVGDVFTRTEGQGRHVQRHFGRIAYVTYKEDTQTGEKTEWAALLQHGANAYTHLGVGSSFSRDADWKPHGEQPAPVLSDLADLAALAAREAAAIEPAAPLEAPPPVPRGPRRTAAQA